MQPLPTSPGPFTIDPDRRHLILDADGKVIAVLASTHETFGLIEGNARLFAEAWSNARLLAECHEQALVAAVAISTQASPGTQSEADAEAAEKFAARVGAQIEKSQGRA